MNLLGLLAYYTIDHIVTEIRKDPYLIYRVRYGEDVQRQSALWDLEWSI